MDKHTQLLSMEAVYEEYFPVVYNYVYYKLLNREHCEDLVSQIFLKVVQNLHRYDPALATMRTWLLRITDNALIDFYRRQKLTLSINDENNGLENTLHVHFDEEYERIISPERRMVLQALQSLSERERTFIYYRYYLGITNREIALRMQMNENTVSAIMARARKKLKTILQEDEM